MKPFRHARNSAKKYGGTPEEYQDIHDFLDQTKVAIPDMRHRAVLHNAWGCFLVERVFGATRKNSAGRTYSPRDVAEDHVLEDLGFIPTLERCFRGMSMDKWFGGPAHRTKVTKNTLEED